ncbi:CRISPR-associated endonuclease Cas2 [Methyloglobulus sp.]|uniref:CRISPR-associated endonuclease Cas2 n=1 Tax=Methyloglobulus sp. TaxID=2518622 RepID=UPI003989B656
MPSPKTTEYLFAYDVSDDKERRKVERLLKGYGFRRQWSVFVCRLTRGDKARLERQLHELALATGFVLMVRIAPSSRPKTIGECKMPDWDGEYAFII